MVQNWKLIDKDGEILHDPSKYQRLVGRLIYLAVTRPDIVYLVRTLSQFMNTPRKPHWEATLWVLKYIKGTPGQGLFLPSEINLTLNAYLIQIEEDVVLQGVLFLVIVFFLDHHLPLGNQRNKRMYHVHR